VNETQSISSNSSSN